MLVSNQHPHSLSGHARLFRQTKNAVALQVLGGRALLVEKRVHTSQGTRIMFGKTVIRPWEKLLESQSVAVHCFTSRSLGIVEKVSASGVNS